MNKNELMYCAMKFHRLIYWMTYRIRQSSGESIKRNQSPSFQRFYIPLFHFGEYANNNYVFDQAINRSDSKLILSTENFLVRFVIKFLFVAFVIKIK